MLQLSSSCSYTKVNLKKDLSFSLLISLLTTRYDNHWARKDDWYFGIIGIYYNGWYFVLSFH